MLAMAFYFRWSYEQKCHVLELLQWWLQNWSIFIWNVDVWNPLQSIKNWVDDVVTNCDACEPFPFTCSFQRFPQYFAFIYALARTHWHTMLNSCLFAGGGAFLSVSLSLSKAWSLIRTSHHLYVFFTWSLSLSLILSIQVRFVLFSLAYSFLFCVAPNFGPDLLHNNSKLNFVFAHASRDLLKTHPKILLCMQTLRLLCMHTIPSMSVQKRIVFHSQTHQNMCRETHTHTHTAQQKMKQCDENRSKIERSSFNFLYIQKIYV